MTMGDTGLREQELCQQHGLSQLTIARSKPCVCNLSALQSNDGLESSDLFLTVLRFAPFLIYI